MLSCSTHLLSSAGFDRRTGTTTEAIERKRMLHRWCYFCLSLSFYQEDIERLESDPRAAGSDGGALC